MELKQLTEQVLKIFSVCDIDKLGEKLMTCVLEHDTGKFEQFVDSVNGDLGEDWLQMIYQYHIADRDNLKQDYTPKSLSALLAQYASRNNVTEIVDLCAGSGALVIQQLVNSTAAITVHCAEIDANVIPYLLFNLAVRNVGGIVQRKDVLKDTVFETYTLTRGDNFATVHKQSAIQSKVDAS